MYNFLLDLSFLLEEMLFNFQVGPFIQKRIAQKQYLERTFSLMKTLENLQQPRVLL